MTMNITEFNIRREREFKILLEEKPIMCKHTNCAKALSSKEFCNHPDGCIDINGNKGDGHGAYWRTMEWKDKVDKWRKNLNEIYRNSRK